ncbi:hypothetical protein DMH04_18505 [Kibdelosporangium aridum]|uniref:Citrate transporter-like domain-containing protein n=1 Tax=Kibdelosporangium aridum TaxID=2030 RepID=A0A428ZB39_KIBAR|nr:SLC13 family permease [Kibdelosporangium aridum]RSM85279.1 hypothetical protein DMH04_18505 [Kibdelosporangium aridum]
MLMLLIGATNAERAFFSEESGVDWNVIVLLLGMMLIITVLQRTGVFEFVAIWTAKRQPRRGRIGHGPSSSGGSICAANLPSG